MNAPLVHDVFHPSDFSEESDAAFAHALAIAARRRTGFTVMHAGIDGGHFPAVRETLERWGLLPEGSPRSAVHEQLGISVRKIESGHNNPLAACVEYLELNPTDLIVLATRGSAGLPHWLQGSVAERLARRTGTKTLFVPAQARGFISAEDGSSQLRRVLVPVDKTPDPTEALIYAARSAQLRAGDDDLEVVVLHVGDGRNMPRVTYPDTPHVTWRVELRQDDDPVEAIVGAASDLQADAIIMGTDGRQGIRDALRGSVTERVLRQSPCPVLAVPAF